MSLPKPSHCESCIGFTWNNCRGYSEVTGTGRVKLLLLGEASGSNEARTGKPFVGKAGEVLEKALRVAGFNRNDYLISNVVRCQPIDNELRGAPYERAIIDHCRTYLDQLILEHQPQFILALGEIPLRELTGFTQAEARGFVLPSRYGIPCIGTFHPSRIARGEWRIFNVLLHDIRQAVRFAQRGVPEKLPTRYNLRPTLPDVEAYIEHLRLHPTLPVSYDIETKEILGGPRQSLEDAEIIQIQFSSAVGEALVLPFEGEFINAAKVIMSLPNPKWDFWGRLFDRKVLRARGFTLNGELHDLYDVAGHMQPDWLSSKDDTNGDKGVPTKLMSLQSWVSMYYPEVGPWKGMVGQALRENRSGWGLYHVMEVLRLYGAHDVDYSFRLGVKLFAGLEKAGLTEGYRRFKYDLSKPLDALTDHGLPVDKEKQAALAKSIAYKDATISEQVQQLVPSELRPIKSYSGWPKDLREVVKAAGLYVKCCKPHEFPEVIAKLGYELIETVSDGEPELPTLIKRLTFNPNSSQQLLRYIEYRGYKVPLHIDTKKPTTGKDGIEQLVRQTNDPMLKLVQKARKLTKLGGTYCAGDWVPGEDGRVHGSFRFGTASGQTSCRGPNVQQFPENFDKEDAWLAEIMDEIKGFIRAEPGHVFVKLDAVGAHAKMQGFLAEDPTYVRLASMDVHSYNVACYLGLPDAPMLLGLDDDSLRCRLNEIKDAHGYERSILKRLTYLMQFGGGAEKAASILHMPVIEVLDMIGSIRAQFPKVFVDYPKSVKRQLQKSPRITTPHKCCRWFWSGDMEEATAFGPSNNFHCHWQDGLIRLYDKGAFSRYGICNYRHDDIWAHVRLELARECIEVCSEEFEKPSTVLVNSLGPFQVAVDAAVGYDMAHMMSPAKFFALKDESQSHH